MADLGKELEELHAEVVRMVRARVAEGGEPEDLRLAMQLLKQNSVTANLGTVSDQALKQRMAAKLSFSELESKVIPLRGPAAEPPRRTTGEQAKA